MTASLTAWPKHPNISIAAWCMILSLTPLAEQPPPLSSVGSCVHLLQKSNVNRSTLTGFNASATMMVITITRYGRLLLPTKILGNWLKVIFSNRCHFINSDMNSWFTFYSIYSQCIGLPRAVSPPLANETGKQPDHLYPTNNVFLSWKYNKWICSWTNNVFLFCWKCNKWNCTGPTTYFSPENTINNKWICAWTNNVFLFC